MGWKTTLALAAVASLICSLNAIYKYVPSWNEPRSSFRDSGMNAWFWTVSLASAGAIWAAERTNHPAVAAVLALLTVVLFLLMDQANVTMNLEFLSKGEIPDGVAVENDEGRDLVDLKGTYGEDGIMIGSESSPAQIPETIVVLLIGCALTSVSVFVGGLYMVIALSTNIPHNIYKICRLKLNGQCRSDDMLGIGSPPDLSICGSQ